MGFFGVWGRTCDTSLTPCKLTCDGVVGRGIRERFGGVTLAGATGWGFPVVSGGCLKAFERTSTFSEVASLLELLVVADCIARWVSIPVSNNCSGDESHV